ncbi:MAG: phosphatidylserine decarboxylase family protein [Planctomycetes bacterium]|nr:phosphatidylserine decarboxylase family protein [Planctomycetota bacterium]
MRIPLAPAGCREMIILTLLLACPAAAFYILAASGYHWAWFTGGLATLLWLCGMAFFRDPQRSVPVEAGILVAPADGKVVEVSSLEQHPDISGPATRIGIFLSVLDVHVNRSPCAGTVRRISYQPGQFLDARDPNSGQLNEANTIVIEPDDPSEGPIVVRQIAGLIARRVVCSVRVGDHVETGQRIGLIKFGSRTELIVKADSGYAPAVAIGDRAYGALTVMARQAGSRLAPRE